MSLLLQLSIKRLLCQIASLPRPFSNASPVSLQHRCCFLLGCDLSTGTPPPPCSLKAGGSLLELQEAHSGAVASMAGLYLDCSEPLHLDPAVRESSSLLWMSC